MQIFFYCFLSLVAIISLLPFIPYKHWVFRVPEFLKIQLLILQLLIVVIGIFYWQEWSGIGFYLAMSFTVVLILHHLIDLLPFTRLYTWVKPKKKLNQTMSKPIKVISSNVYQFNQSYNKLIDLIEKEKPDIILTMESNKDWEKALQKIEKDYPYQLKQTQENTYGMHFYSKLKVVSQKKHFFIDDEIPCFEIELVTNDGYAFDFYGVHPPPPSPTEEENSKERDGELMCLTKNINKKKSDNCIVVGDFNNVAWASSTKRFRRLSGLIDPRFGRGFVCTFHAKYPFLRMPIDLIYHSEHIFIKSFKRLSSIDSDHFPLSCIFQIGTEKVEESIDDKERAEDKAQRDIDIKEGVEQFEKN